MQFPKSKIKTVKFET